MNIGRPIREVERRPIEDPIPRRKQDQGTIKEPLPILSPKKPVAVPS